MMKAKKWFKDSASGWKASIFIMGAVVFRGSVNYALVWVLMDYMTDFWANNIGIAAATVNIKEGVESLATIFGIFITDAFVGRYFVLLVSISLYIYGLVLFSFSVGNSQQLFLPALVLLAAGEGGMESSLREFGVDQFPIEMEKKKSSAPSRIWWYGCSFIGSVLGMLLSGFIFNSYDEERPWAIVGHISTALMAGAFFGIVAGTLLYRIERPPENPFNHLPQVLVAVVPKSHRNGCIDESRIRGRCHPKQGRGGKEGLATNNGCRELVLKVDSSRTRCNHRSDGHADLSCNIGEASTKGYPKDDRQMPSGDGMPKMELGVLASDDQNPNTVDANNDTNGLPRTDQPRRLELEESKMVLSNQREVEEAKTFLSVCRIWTSIGFFPFGAALGLFPIWTTFIMYGIVVSMGETFFLEQASSLDLNIGESFDIPLAFLLAISALSKLLVSRACLPLLSKGLGLKHGIPPTVRIGVGQILITLCCFTASLIEDKRLSAVKEHNLQDNSDVPVPMSVVWLFPQYALSGAMSALLSDGISDFFVDQVRSPLRRGKEIFLESILCMGRFLSALAIVVTRKFSRVGGRPSWFADEINRCGLDDYYKTFALLSCVNLCLYLYFAKRHPWNMTPEEEKKTVTEVLQEELEKQGMKAQAQDQKRRQEEREDDGPQTP